MKVTLNFKMPDVDSQLEEEELRYFDLIREKYLIWGENISVNFEIDESSGEISASVVSIR